MGCFSHRSNYGTMDRFVGSMHLKAKEICGVDEWLKPGERMDDLMIDDMKIIQRADRFRFGTDAVLLSDFATPKKGDRVADFGTGTGVLPLLMHARQKGATYDALEIQPEMAEMAARSVRLNGLEDVITVREADLREAANLLERGRYTLAVCNPPYSPAGTALVSRTDAHRIARHESECTIEDICVSAAALLKNGGRLAMIYPAPRIFDLMCAMRKYRLEPKRIRTIHQAAGKEPKLVLIDATKGAKSMLHWLPPLILSEVNGEPTDEWKRIYHA